MSRAQGLDDPEVQEVINSKLEEIGIDYVALRSQQPYVYKMMCLCYLQNLTHGELNEANFVQNAEAIAEMQRMAKEGDLQGFPMMADEAELSQEAGDVLMKAPRRN